MFTLVTDRSKYYRIKQGQSARDIERVLKTPVCGRTFAGEIIEVRTENLTLYSAKVGDTYRTVALKFGADECELKRINGDKPVYPTCKIFVPIK